jgi:hypothetical protein
MRLLDLLRLPDFVWLILDSGDGRRGPSTSGGKEMVRGMRRDDSLAVLDGDEGEGTR